MTATITKLSMLDAALAYARRGWRAFPLYTCDGAACTCGNSQCKSIGKHPKTANGVLDATIDERQIEIWFGGKAMPSNIGIATGRESNLIVVDVDVAKGGDIDDLWTPFDMSLEFSDAPTVKTGGGFHFYFSYPPNIVIKNSASKLGKFIDVRGDNGYVVAPPSIHQSGKIYHFLETSIIDLLEFPAAWSDHLSNPTATSTPLLTNGNGTEKSNGAGLFVPPPYQNLVVPDEIVTGARNDSLTRIAGSLRRIDLNKAEIEAALLSINNRTCKPPLEAQEVRSIAYNVGKYAASEALEEQSDADDGQNKFENTLRAYLLGDFLNLEFEELEILAFHISKKEIGIIQAPTNAGKTTILRNAALSMACGRPFKPFYDGGRPIKLAYFDFESSRERAQPDLRIMIDALTLEEQRLAKENFILIPKGIMKGELFQFNRNESWVNSLLTGNGVEFVVVDNISAAYDLNDENSNAEVNKKVIKPLLKLAYQGDCAFLFAHHYGKGKSELEHAGVHAGRGASTLQGLSQTVINMFGNVSKGEPITIECAKRKTDGGKEYRQVLELREDRWFHETMIVPPPKRKTAYQTIREFMAEIIYPNTISTAEIIQVFDNVFSEIQSKRTILELYKDGFLERPKHGFYCNKNLTNGEN